ncbi:hypothetical protein M378DRAFT_165850 [Amanita muscaria Koide BX008]|uniref:Uncharacterized protein n=1 Tax=Amanita muscaria (strain Koide BX008) TaxID=946122 RepID=A0A0C2WZL2_AMAMK|nr:hypothetical protein M378DRAFT_165850 [Amanita muscaria Koide BX008]
MVMHSLNFIHAHGSSTRLLQPPSAGHSSPAYLNTIQTSCSWTLRRALPLARNGS